MMMKVRIQIILTFTFLLLGNGLAEAQYRTGSPYYGGRPNSIIPRSNDEKPEPKALTASEMVANEMPKISEAADLNEFEEAVVTSILTKYVQQTIELRLLELEPNKTRENLQKIKANQDAELKAGLPDEKYMVIKEIQEKGLNKVSSQKKKEKKKKKSKNK